MQIEPDTLKLDSASVRWSCDKGWLAFESTAQVEPMRGIVGQDDAVEALLFGLRVSGLGQNVFIRGLTGTGRTSLVRQLLQEQKACGSPGPDRIYVHNFEQPDRPRLISLGQGKGRILRRLVDDLLAFIREQLVDLMSADATRAERNALMEALQEEILAVTKPFEEELRENGLALVPMQMGPITQPAIVPIINGKPVSQSEIEEMQAAGRLSEEDAEALLKKVVHFVRRFGDINYDVQRVQAEHRQRMREFNEQVARQALSQPVMAIESELAEPEVVRFVEAVIDDLIEHQLATLGESFEFLRRYEVNVLQDSPQGGDCPIIVENTPTVANLLGTIEREFLSGGVLRSDHLMIQAGSLLRADGGFLIMEAREVLNEPGAWKMLMRTLRTGKLEIVPSDMAMFWSGPLLKPEAIDLDVKIVLIGEPDLHYMLDALDPDFPHLFKVLADFDSTIGRDQQGANYYAGILGRICEDESLLPFSREAVAAVVEQGARVAGRAGRLSARFGRIADIAREAAFLAAQAGRDLVGQEDVREAVRRGRRRANLPARKFRSLVHDRTIRIQTEGGAIGQINGLAVMRSGPLTYGFPSRITATIGPGTAGTMNIEREAELSGAIHTKGFYILGGLLRHLLRTNHPLAFSASIAFEQSYGGIDGDSASGAEMCCLLSALTGIAIDQSLAMTGAIDQHGQILPVGAVTEKVEGFYAVCRDRGFNGHQGVVIPLANAGDLMLNPEVVEACQRGDFSVYAVDSIHEALAVMTGHAVAVRNEAGAYPEGTLLAVAEAKATEYWELVAATARPAH